MQMCNCPAYQAATHWCFDQVDAQLAWPQPGAQWKAIVKATCNVRCSHPLRESLLSRGLGDIMAWPQVPQVQIHIILPDPISAGMILGLAR